jgi:4-amino-4-deoxy-L-arabinose transferase-like glycosyltransferase
MHGATSKEMVLSGDWVTPFYNGEKFYDKPPFFNWLVACSFLLLGFTEVAARLPAALLGTGTVLLTYMLGRRLFHARVGFLGAVILATSIEFIILSRSVVHDIALAFTVTLSMYAFYRALNATRIRFSHLALGYFSIGLAVLSKGPVGLLLPALSLMFYLQLNGQLVLGTRLKLLWGGIIICIVAAPWYVLMAVRNPDYISYFFFEQNLQNFLSQSGARHPEPFYFYFPVILGGMLPWSFFLPPAIAFLIRNCCKAHSAATAFLIAWFSVIFVFFSVAQSKLPSYILPALPAAALIIGQFWHERIGRPGAKSKGHVAILALPLVLVICALIGFDLVTPLTMLSHKYGIPLHYVKLTLLGLGALFAVAFLSGLYMHWRTAFGVLAASLVLGIHVFLSAFIPFIEPYRTTRELALEVDRMLPPGQPIVFYRGVEDTAVFYTQRRGYSIGIESNLIEFFKKNRAVYCIIKATDYKKTDGIIEISYIHRRVGHQLLLSNRPSTDL